MVEQKIDFPYNPHKTNVCSEPLFKFIVEYDLIIGFLMFVVQTASHTDRVLQIAAEVVNDQEMKDLFSKNTLFRQVQYYRTLISRNLVIDMVNNFLAYLSEIIQIAVLKKPEILRSSDRFTAEEILQFSKMTDAISYIADKKITELSYGGLRQMEQFIDDRLGLKLFESDEERRLLTIFVELRNIQTHNRGVVNDLFLNRLGKHPHKPFSFKLGARSHAGFDDFILLSRNAITIAQKLDAKIARKFKLKRSKFKARFSAHKKKRIEELNRLPLAAKIEPEPQKP